MVWTYSFLRCSGVPGGNGSILDVSQWALFTSVACCIGLVVSVNNPAWGSNFAHVKHHISSRPHGGDWLHPRTRSLSKLIAWVCADGPHTHVVHALREEPDLGAGAGVVAGGVGHGCLIHGVPVTKVLKSKELIFTCCINWSQNKYSLPFLPQMV